jgi:hypothetical protein
MHPTYRASVASTHVPVRHGTEITIIPRPHDFIDTCIECSYLVSISFFGVGSLGVMAHGNLLSRNHSHITDYNGSSNASSYMLTGGLMGIGLTKLINAWNTRRHAQYFDSEYARLTGSIA